jgi:hypothetical protein
MPRYTILPYDKCCALAEIEATDPSDVLAWVARRKCQRADVLEAGRYRFSVRLSDSGVWSIYQRDEQPGDKGQGDKAGGDVQA